MFGHRLSGAAASVARSLATVSPVHPNEGCSASGTCLYSAAMSSIPPVGHHGGNHLLQAFPPERYDEPGRSQSAARRRMAMVQIWAIVRAQRDVSAFVITAA